ncbi:MAG: rhomboid family intramembrane serine protease [Gemmatimonadota bacterium]
MGFSDRSYNKAPSGPSRRWAPSLTPWVKRLLALNFGLWLVGALGLLAPGFVRLTAFDPSTLVTHPWTPLTYMFVHGGFWHVAFNMLGVFFFGPPLERLWGGRGFIRFYLVCGLGAALASILLWPLIGPHSVVGASGAVFGLLLAFGMRWPDQPIYLYGLFPIKAKWFVTGLAVLSLVSTYRTAVVGRGDGVAHWTHLGGLLTAYLYLKYRETGRILPARFSMIRRGWKVSSGGDTGDSAAPTSRQRWPGSGSASGEDESGTDSGDRVDRILEKIRDSGLESLSGEEKRFLDEMSRRYRGGP